METKREAKHLRIFISNTDKFRYSPLYEVIVFAAKRYGMAGATVLNGVMGYGSSSKVRSMKFWEITEKLPLVIEIIDEAGTEKGKKLGFISQEMGREINTIGSKSNNGELQKLVVLMKEQLEKIKEQLNNIL